jgi:hypothetical protein
MTSPVTGGDIRTAAEARDVIVVEVSSSSSPSPRNERQLNPQSGPDDRELRMSGRNRMMLFEVRAMSKKVSNYMTFDEPLGFCRKTVAI